METATEEATGPSTTTIDSNALVDSDLSFLEGFEDITYVTSRDSAQMYFKAKKRGELALVSIEKTPFVLGTTLEEQANALSQLFSRQTSLQLTEHNDIYYQFSAQAAPLFSNLRVKIIYPCPESQIPKPADEVAYGRETKEIYNEVTLPWLNSLPESKIQWVYNILDHKKETENIIFEDTDDENGFILVPDFKWDRSNTSMVYCLAIARRRNIRSLRDLNETHLPLLKNLRDKGTSIICNKFGLQANQLRVLVHYYPSFYHLHVHYISTNFSPLEPTTIAVGRAYLLDDIIGNIELKPDYYQEATLSYYNKEEALNNALKQYQKKKAEIQ
eukprot:TRINITY_DN4638_c0_g1_i1.p1 TRINITY_DN4638_c0_g1~~TRINITY_DN4638_c0_g1_i1.p1  ORF type:complete len:340 (+),score=85.42 TRINITY_DN4638_c0_g1_i1:31-1020(+)